MGKFPDKNNLYLIGLIVLLTASSGILAMLLFKPTFSIPNLLSKSYQVVITDEGFSPESIEISQGDSVRFINKSGIEHWVASDNHPLHELYPELDTKKPISKDESWEFTFSKAGKWGYHDHLNPSLHGNVVVLPKSGTKQKVSTQSNKLSTFVETEKLIREKGPEAAWKDLVSQNQQLSSENMHDIAHAIGQELYKSAGLHSLDICDPSFAFGCYHGVFEEYITLNGLAKLPDVIDYCRTKHPQVAVTCYHGLGHGLLPYYKYQLTPALDECDKLLGDANASYCHRGVFMEEADVFMTKASKADPLWPCNTVADKYKLACYNYQMIYLAHLYSTDTAQIEKACLQAESKELQTECIKGVGHNIAQRTHYDTVLIKKYCNGMAAPHSYDCIIAAAQESVFQGQDNREIEEDLCAILPDTYQADCSEKAAFQAKIRQ